MSVFAFFFRVMQKVWCGVCIFLRHPLLKINQQDSFALFIESAMATLSWVARCIWFSVVHT
jgi:hypothetical protein